MTLNLPTIDIVGPGRMGLALTRALKASGVSVNGPHGRGADCEGAAVALLCVPDTEIMDAADQITADVLVGHCSGASTLEPLGNRRGFSIHPLMTVPNEHADFDGVTCAIAGTDEETVALAIDLADAISMRAIEIDDDDRAAYHAAASIASNFLITLEAAASQLASTVGVSPNDLRPLIEASVANFFELGGEKALTGPIARGDQATIAKQRAAIEARTHHLLPLYDAMVDATRDISVVGAVGAVGATR